MAATLAEAAEQFAELGRNLQLVGAGELKRELYKAISDAAKPVAAEIKDVEHLKPYMPDRYAEILGRDLSVRAFKRTTGNDAGVTIHADAPTIGRGGRKVAQREAGIIVHPIFAQGPRRSWRWKAQTAGMRSGFFTDPCQRAAPAVRKAIVDALDRVERKALGGR